jgi:multimeric flavodoxin WrbA
MKNILVLTGSPRKEGNSDLMANAFIRGAKAQGHKITKFEAARKTIGGCRACGKCWSQGNACVFRDDFSELEPLVETADVLVLVSPLYWFSMSAQIKAAVDRLNAYDAPNCQRPLHIKESILLTCGDGSEVFDGIIKTYSYMVDYMKWRNAGILSVPNVKEKGDILKTDALLQAELLGRKI